MAGRVALVTGAGGGIGRASAVAFAAAGARVVVSDLAEGAGEETAASIRAAGGEAVFVPADVSVPGDVEALVAAALGRYGRLDYAHNNAGVNHHPLGGRALTHELELPAWERVIAVNLTGVWLCMKHELRQMLAAGGGAIVNTASIVGLGGARRIPAYVASKHGVVGLTRAAALEYARHGIRVNAVCPGSIRTPMYETRLAVEPDPAAFEAATAEEEPMGRVGGPEEVAAAVVWLCSDAASYVNGHCLSVDGGWGAH